MFAVEMLPAGCGDSLIVEYGTGSARHRILIDAGPLYAWPDVRARLLKRADDRYDLFVVTHVDEDHIGGALSLLDDPDLRHTISQAWFNGYVHCKQGGNVLGPVNGEQLTLRIASGGIGWNNRPERGTGAWGPIPGGATPAGGALVVPDSGPLPTFPLPGVPDGRIVLLGPTRKVLAAMAGVWVEALKNSGIMPGAGAAGHQAGQSPRPPRRTIVPLPGKLDGAWLGKTAGAGPKDTKEANASSIALIVEYGGKRVLLPGDSTWNVLAPGLARYAAELGRPSVPFDLVKLPHHGSGANFTREVASLLQGSRFLVSSDGMLYGHPDDSALARAISVASGPATFYCDYASFRTTPWAQRAGDLGVTFVLPKAGTAGLRVVV